MLYYHLLNLVRGFVWSRPQLYRPIGRFRRNADVSDLDYDLSIEGYPRSANTFLLQLMKMTQPGLRIRSHRHIPPHAIAAVRANLPVLFLIRPPLDCVTSFAIMCGTPAAPHLASYVAYHKVLRPYADRLFVATFSSVVNDPKAVLEAFAHRYGLPLDMGFDLHQFRSRVFAKIEQDHLSESGELDERFVNRPSEARAARKSVLVAELGQARFRPWLQEANALYAEFLARSV